MIATQYNNVVTPKAPKATDVVFQQQSCVSVRPTKFKWKYIMFL